MKILPVGYNRPAFQGHAKLEAAHSRTRQLVQPLLDEGHTVALCAPA